MTPATADAMLQFIIFMAAKDGGEQARAFLQELINEANDLEDVGA